MLLTCLPNQGLQGIDLLIERKKDTGLLVFQRILLDKYDAQRRRYPGTTMYVIVALSMLRRKSIKQLQVVEVTTCCYLGCVSKTFAQCQKSDYRKG
jgi:hypothetical protein